MKQISPNVYVETGIRGCNPGFVTTSEGVVMIDTPFMPSDAQVWRKEVGQRGQAVYLINTEHHADHISGNGFFGGTVVSHEGTRQAFASSLTMAREVIAQMEPQGFALWEAHSPRPPTITFSERLTLHVGQHTFQLLHLVGHTANEVVVLVPEERVVFASDNVFHKRQVYLHEAYPFQWLETLRKIEALDVDLIVPGHGDVCGKPYLRELSDFIQEWIEAVRGATNRGLSKEEVTHSISFLDRYPMNPGRDYFGPELQRMNAARLYDVLTQGEENLLKGGR